jgi:hypothetical protein
MKTKWRIGSVYDAEHDAWTVWVIGTWGVIETRAQLAQQSLRSRTVKAMLAVIAEMIGVPTPKISKGLKPRPNGFLEFET